MLFFQSLHSDDEENEVIAEENEAIDDDSGDIYYNRDINEEQKYMDNFGEYSENTSSSKSRDFLPYGEGTQDKQDEYNFAGLQSAGMQLENPTSSSEADAMAQQDAINQMIYGDLGADTEMLDLDINNEAIGFELHSNRTFSGMPQNTFDSESNSQTFDPVETDVPAVVEQPNVEVVQIQEEVQTQVRTQSETEQPNVEEPSTFKLEETEPEMGCTDPKDLPFEKGVSIEPTQETTNTLEQPTQATETEISEPVVDQTTCFVPTPKEEAVSSQTIEKANSDPFVFGKASTKSRSRNNSTSTDEPKTPARRTRRTASQDTTNDVEKSAEVDVPKARLRKASSQQSLSSQGEGGSAEITMPLRRITRSASQKSLNEDIEVASIERTKRGTSQQRDMLETKSEPKTPTTSKVSSRRASKQDSKTDQKQTDMESSQQLKPKTLKRKNTRDKLESSVDLGDTFNAEESASSRRLRKAVSHTNLNDIIEEDHSNRSPLPKRKRGKDSSSEGRKPPSRAVSHQSLSSISETNSTDENPIEKRSSRAGSVAKDEPKPRRAASQNALNIIANESLPKTTRRKRAQSEAPEIETDLGDRFNAEESVSSRRLRKAVSHQTLSSIDEIVQTPTKPKGRSKRNSESEARPPRRAASHQSLNSLSEKEVESPTTRSRAKKAVAAVKKQDSEPKTPSRRTRRAASEKESPSDTVAEKKSTKTKRGTKKDDDTNSDASSIISTRGRKTPAIDNEDDGSSVKSTKAKKVTRTVSALPAIAENEDFEAGTSEYLESSRLTRSQRSAIKKYATKTKVFASNSSVKVKIEKEEDTEFVESDTESLKSQTSKLSKKSKASEASSQRTTRSLRSKK